MFPNQGNQKSGGLENRRSKSKQCFKRFLLGVFFFLRFVLFLNDAAKTKRLTRLEIWCSFGNN
jgi:hypothetical protein